MDRNEDLLANLETRKSEVVAAQALAEESLDLLRKTKEEKKKSQVEACCLAEEKMAMMAEKEKTEEEVVRLRLDLQDPWAGFDSLYFFYSSQLKSSLLYL